MNFKELAYLLVTSNEAQIVFRIFLAICFGALIGLEREHAKRPAGLRTHILVCLGACLVMLTSEYMYNYYHQFSPNMDIARLGAQVISGIGFLGAGTIIRNGSSVKGLTTAASIWAVGCIGLATGIGFYFGATIATVAIFLCLSYIKKVYRFHDSQQIALSVIYNSTSDIDLIPSIEKIFSENSITINNLSIKSTKENETEVYFNLLISESVNTTSMLSTIYSLPGIISININSKKSLKEDA